MSVSICIPGSFCLDVLHFCSVDVTSNLSYQLLCFIMLSYCSYFIIVYNYISLISCLFILTRFITGRRRRRIMFFRPVCHTKHTIPLGHTKHTIPLCHTKHTIPFKTTQNNININYTIQKWTDTMFCSTMSHCSLTILL